MQKTTQFYSKINWEQNAKTTTNIPREQKK